MLPFVPRKVAQASKHISSAGSTSQLRRIVTVNPPIEDTVNENQRTKFKAKAEDIDAAAVAEDYHTLLWLALSDHAIWADSHLRSRLVNASDGYIPLRYLLSHSPVLSALDPPPSETAIAKAIRAQRIGSLDVRVLVSAPSRAVWYGKDSTKDQLGGYEVRRRDWAEVLQTTQELTEDDWAARSVYMENIPFHYRTMAAIARFVHSLATCPATSELSAQVVQNVWLPPHSLDKPGDRPKCKGFALITLSSADQAETLAHHWPWDVDSPKLQNMVDNSEIREGVKSGFRVMPRARWDELREDYLAYRRTLLEVLAHSEQATEETTHAAAIEERIAPQSATSDLPTTDAAPPYPQGCLVFVRNIHPETNKTTLRSLFSQAFSDNDSADIGVDYVDFSKGMDTCYLRLASARYTQLLTAFFAAHTKAQRSGLDATGAMLPAGVDVQAITFEVVEGTREELYWNRVPEKVRRQAVEKATTTAVASMQSEKRGEGQTVASDLAEGTRKRKRRKRGE